jgi:heme A synthase
MSTVRPVPRWVRLAGIVTVLLCVLLLALGGFVTTFRVGMADPVWPTEPWFLLGQDWQQLEFGFLVEHTHRLAGWLTGAAVSLFAVGAWLAEPDRRLKIVGLVTLVGLLASYGEFHRGMGKVWSEVQEKAREQRHLDPKQSDFADRLVESDVLKQVTKWPVGQGLGTAAFAVAVLCFGVVAATRRTPGGWVRFAANLGLVFVMVQGLLGGFRVFLNALAGTNLAAIHGVFGQVTFAVLVAAMVLCSPRRESDSLAENDRASLTRLAWVTVGVLLVQLVWAVWVRHYGSSVAQRLHILTAFVATGFLVWLAAKILLNPAAKAVFRGIAIHLMFILGTQLLLGVESYMGKFVAAGPQAQKLPEERQVTKPQAVMRTAHQLIGAGLLAATVAAAVRLGRRPK